jgi:hypothetical protein
MAHTFMMLTTCVRNGRTNRRLLFLARDADIACIARFCVSSARLQMYDVTRDLWGVCLQAWPSVIFSALRRFLRVFWRYPVKTSARAQANMTDNFNGVSQSLQTNTRVTHRICHVLSLPYLSGSNLTNKQTMRIVATTKLSLQDYCSRVL